MLYNEEAVRANIRNREGKRIFYLGKGDQLTSAARDYLSRDLEKKARRDGEYAQHITFWFDLKCFLLTIVKVINRQGIAEGAEGKDEKSGSADSDHTNEKRAEGQP